MQKNTFSDQSDVEQALIALATAQNRALRSGRSVIVLVDDQLIRLDSKGQRTVLKQMPPRSVVSGRKKLRLR